MGQVISIEQLKIEREQKLRSYAFKHFPWQELELIQLYILQPLCEGWSKQKQIIVTEATYRLVFDAYFLGLKARKKRKSLKKISVIDDRIFAEEIRRLIENVMCDFMIPRCFSRQQRESMQILFQSLAQEWFLCGLVGGEAKE